MQVDTLRVSASSLRFVFVLFTMSLAPRMFLQTLSIVAHYHQMLRVTGSYLPYLHIPFTAPPGHP